MKAHGDRFSPVECGVWLLIVMYGRGTRSRPGSGRIVNVYSKRKSEARLSEFAKAQNHKAESLSLVVAFSLNQKNRSANKTDKG